MKKNAENPLVVGDLVYHLLYGKDWIGLVLGFGVMSHHPKCGLRDVVRVQMQFGTEHEYFFQRATKKYRITDSLGYVSRHWLRALEEYK